MKKEIKIKERLPGDHYINLGQGYIALGRLKEAERFKKCGEGINELWKNFIAKEKEFSPTLVDHQR